MGTKLKSYTITLDGEPLKFNDEFTIKGHYAQLPCPRFIAPIVAVKYTITYRLDRWLRKILNKIILFGNLKN